MRNGIIFCGLVLVSELRDPNVRNEVLDNIFIFTSKRVERISFVMI